MTSPSESSVADILAAERKRKQDRAESSLWFRLRLIIEILYQQIRGNRTFSLAAALTYKTLFSLLPIFVLTLLVLSTISAGSGDTALDRSARKMIFSQLSLDKLPVTNANGQPLQDPRTHKDVTAAEFVTPLLEKAKDAVSSRFTGLIALAILIYGSVSLMIVIEETFNSIYGSVPSRSWLRRIILYCAVLTLGPIGIAASIFLERTAHSTADALVGGGWLFPIFHLFTAFLISWFVALLLFKFVPDTRVDWRAALLGSSAAALAWEIGKWGFGLYVEHALRHSWYGSLALLPLFMMWIYLSWSVILLGLHVSYLTQYLPMLKRQYFVSHRDACVSDVRWILALAILLYRSSQQNKPLRMHEAADDLMIPNTVVSKLLSGLERAGIIEQKRAGDFTLARSPASITAYDLLAVGHSLADTPPDIDTPDTDSIVTARTALSELREIENKWAQAHSLADLAVRNS